MSVPVQVPINTHIGNGLTTSFAYQFLLFKTEDAKVTLDGVDVDPVLYTVSALGEEAGGFVTFNTAPGTGVRVVIRRNVGLQRLTNYQYAGPFPAATINADLDRLWLALQDLGLDLSTAVRLPADDDSNPLLPSVAGRALMILGFDASGKLTVVPATAGDATALALALASKVIPSQGGGMVGFDQSVNYGVGTIGARIQAFGSSATEAVGAWLLGFKRNASAVGRSIGSKLAEIGSTLDKGAVADGVADDTAPAQAAMLEGGGLRFTDGTHRITAPLSVDYSSTSFPAPGLPSPRVDLAGVSQGNTIIKQATAGADGIRMTGRADAVYQGVHGMDRVSNMTIARSTPGTGRGLRMDHKAYALVENLTIRDYSFGLWLNGVLSSSFKNLYLTGNGVGAVIDYTGSALLPNANIFEADRFADSSTAGFIANNSGATNLVLGGSNENNSATGMIGGGGMLLNVTGANGIATWNLQSHYFEANGGEADLSIVNTSNLPITVVLTGCTFNRVLAGRYTTTNIKLANTGGGSIKCVLVGCGFLSGGTYSPSALRPFWVVDGASEIIDIGCTYSESTSKPPSCRASANSVVSAVIDSNGTPLSPMPPGVSVAKTATGTYTVTHARGWGIDTYGYAASTTALSTTNRANAVNNSGTEFAVYTLNSAGVAVDERFSFSVSSFH